MSELILDIEDVKYLNLVLREAEDELILNIEDVKYLDEAQTYEANESERT